MNNYNPTGWGDMEEGTTLRILYCTDKGVGVGGDGGEDGGGGEDSGGGGVVVERREGGGGGVNIPLFLIILDYFKMMSLLLTNFKTWRG